MKIKKLIILLSTIAFVALQLLFLNWYEILLPIIALWLLIIFFTTWFTIVDKILSPNFLYYLSVPMFFSLSVFGMNAILEQGYLHYGLIAGAAFLLWLYFTQIALFNFDFVHYVSPAVENVSGYMNLISLFFLSIFGSALIILIGLPLWSVLLAIVAVSAAIIHQSTWVAQIEQKNRLTYLISLSIILAEVFWSLSLLPTNFFLQGLLYTVTFYFCWNIAKSSLLGILSRKLVVRYLVVAVVSVSLAALTAQWI